MLDKHGNVGKLEGTVQKGGIQRRADAQLFFSHLLDSGANLGEIHGDVGKVDDQQPSDDANGQHGSHPAHQIRSENGHHKDKYPNEESAQ